MMKTTLPQIIYSNRVEELYQELKGRLFAGTQPFARRIVIVPTASIKTWLTQTMAADPDLGICAGVEIMHCDAAFDTLAASLRPEEDFGYSPTKVEVALAIESLLQQITSDNDTSQTIWAPVQYYLENSPKKTTQLATQIARIFNDYGRIGPTLFAKLSEEDQWQSALWDLLEKKFAPWSYPARRLTTPLTRTKTENITLHFFCVNQLTPLHHQFLANLPSIAHYVLSPCLKFWGDIVSHKERIRMEKRLAAEGVADVQIEELDGYLTDTNPLLANLGKLGRTQARLFEGHAGETTEIYVAPEGAAEHPRYSDDLTEEVQIVPAENLSLLTIVRTDLLTLKNPHTCEKLSLPTEDYSIQLHAVPKASREVEVAYNLIIEALKTGVNPHDIVVAAPNIDEYVPYIRSTFSGSKPIPYHIDSAQNPLTNPTIRSFLQLVALAGSRWEATALLALFRTKPFQRRHALGQEDVDLLDTIVEKTGIRWGRSSEHRKKIFAATLASSDASHSTGTWHEGFHKASDNSSIGFADTCKVLSDLFKQLEKDLESLEDSQERTIDSWTQYLRNLYAIHFACNTASETEVEGERMLLGAIAELSEASERMHRDTFPATTLLHHLRDLLARRGSSQPCADINTVRICSIGDVGPLPMQVLILMGMVDGAYPTADRVPSFHLMHKPGNAQELFTRIDRERYQFLETLLSVRKQLLILYPTQEGGDTSEHPPSSIVTDLFHYLDSTCDIAGKKPSEVCQRRHPLLPFHYRYFTLGSGITTYISEHYEAAAAYYHPDRKKPPTFISELQDAQLLPREEISTIPLGSLSAFAKHPIQTYLRKDVGVYIEREDPADIKDEDPIACTPYQKATLFNKSVKESPEIALALARTNGSIPKGFFGQLDMLQITQEANDTAHLLASKGIDLADTFTIELDEKYVQIQQNESSWQLPPLLLNVGATDPIKIVGKLENVHRDGILFFVEDQLKKAVEIWPQILTFCMVIDKYKLPLKKTVFFAKGGDLSVKSAEGLDSTELLKRFAKYYLSSKATPTPLMPQWITPILKGNFTTIAKDTADDAFGQTDAYLRWLGERASEVAWTDNMAQWKETTHALFEDLVTAWYPRSLPKQSVGKGEADV